MNDQYVRNVVEAALLAAGRPLASDELVTLFDERDGSNAEEVKAAIEVLRGEYETRGLELVEVASGYRIQIRHAVAQPVSRLWQERPTKYSRALLETLALVAYRQPITRGEIEQIRGVAVNPNIIKTLLERTWIRVVGHRDVPGKPELLGTTRDFLDYFSLQKLDDLPTLAQLKELEELRVQLSLPGADKILGEPSADAAGTAAPGEGAGEARDTTQADSAEDRGGAARAEQTSDASHESAEHMHASDESVDDIDSPDEGAEATDASVEAGQDADASGEDEVAAHRRASGNDDDMDDAADQHRPQGLVARGGADDQH